MTEQEPRIVKAQYAKGRVVMICPSDGSGQKTRAARLAEAFGGRWVNRSRGYNMSPKRAESALQHWREGYDAYIRMFTYDKRRPAELLIPPKRRES